MLATAPSSPAILKPDEMGHDADAPGQALRRSIFPCMEYSLTSHRVQTMLPEVGVSSCLSRNPVCISAALRLLRRRFKPCPCFRLIGHVTTSTCLPFTCSHFVPCSHSLAANTIPPCPPTTRISPSKAPQHCKTCSICARDTCLSRLVEPQLRTLSLACSHPMCQFFPPASYNVTFARNR